MESAKFKILLRLHVYVGKDTWGKQGSFFLHTVITKYLKDFVTDRL